MTPMFRLSAALAVPAALLLSPVDSHAQLLNPGQEIHGLTGGAIVRFSDRSPRRTTAIVQRLFGSQAIVAIDFSPRDGQLYALDNAGGLYRMALDVGQQIEVGRIEGALIGSFYDIDFDPADGRLRIATDAGTHLLHDLGTNRTQVLPLLNNAGTPGTLIGTAGIAHGNNDTSAATASPLYLIDHERDRLARVDGATSTVATIAPLAPARRFARPVTTFGHVGFDILSRVDGSGRATADLAFVSLQPDDFTSPAVVYRMDLATGRLTSLGSINTVPAGDLIDIAVRPDSQPPVPATAGAAAIVTGPLLGLSTASIDFAEQPVGTRSAARVVTVRNDGDADLEIRAAAGQPGPFASSYQCPDFLPPGETCTITVHFAPTVEGPASSRITVLTNAPSTPDVIGLSGRGVTPILQPSSTAIDFGSRLVGLPTLPAVLELRNAGTGTLRLESVAISGDFQVRSLCGTELAAGATCSLRISFRPTATGPRGGELTLVTDLVDSPTRVSLSGSGRRLLDGRN